MIKLKDIINEGPDKNRYQFNTLQDLNKANSALYKAGFYSQNANPPTGKEPGSFNVDNNWIAIDVIRGHKEAAKIFKKLKLDYGGKYKKPIGYKVFNHGGYYD
jgi:hypothetical protein